MSENTNSFVDEEIFKSIKAWHDARDKRSALLLLTQLDGDVINAQASFIGTGEHIAQGIAANMKEKENIGEILRVGAAKYFMNADKEAADNEE